MNKKVTQKLQFPLVCTHETIAARCCFFVHWYEVSPLGGRQLQNGGTTARVVDKGRVERCYSILWSQNAKPVEYSQTDCGRVWCRCDVRPTGAIMVPWWPRLPCWTAGNIFPTHLTASNWSFGIVTCLLSRGNISWHRRFPTDDTVTDEVQERLQEQDSSVYREGLENLVVRFEKFLNKYVDCMGK